jgi:hypothetical protein
MLRGGITALTLVVALVAVPSTALAADIPALPPIVVPDTPDLPAPPATLGRCIAAAQDYGNAWGRLGEDARAVGIGGLNHQVTHGTGLLNVGFDLLAPDEDGITGAYVAILTTTGTASNGTSQALLPLAPAASNATTTAVNGSGMAVVAALPAAADTMGASLPWFQGRFSGVLNPVNEWNKRTTLSQVTGNPMAQVTFFMGLTVAQVHGPMVPVGPTYGALAGAQQGLGHAGSGADGLGDAAVAATDASARNAGTIAGAASPLAMALVQGAGSGTTAAQGHAQGMSATLGNDAALLQGAATAHRNGLVARTQALPGQAAGCPTMN